jgi:hypothetical protein
MWPDYPERIEIHGAKGTAIVVGDKLTNWDVAEDSGEDPPISTQNGSGASDPMAISTIRSNVNSLTSRQRVGTGELLLAQVLMDGGRFNLFLPRTNRAVLIVRVV